ncbi:HET-domain-containing protein [Lentinus tigrinus ALCF2SS1-6]|uniref:HET-domain-containing protein n=1 Tax=Lentinus tigrinus ALCF2SS1-6 TaxID=1328759 RepID=A0A5C2SJ60_9APHY|nr:HET-domain-containing protein [Lentinus tigrinus ALCF2SS1-6]
MWLLDATTFALFSVDDPSQVRYAAVSHVWNALGEPSFQALHTEIERTLGSEPDDEQVQAYIEGHGNHAFWSKIASACAFARAHGYQYIWIDTCCINKMSSAELSEAVNSMFEWYAQASVCYAYLHDVPDHEYPSGERSKFRSSKWFKRGWTLQELVAPRFVVFLSKDWTVLGTKHVLARVIEEITHISRAVLTHEESLDAVSIAERMSWASERQTTRVEDEAYSLLGIFGIHMPTIYGEGNQAFIRLQEEILRRIPDQSLFAISPPATVYVPGFPSCSLI